ncbi:hypothetical protein VN97_g2407 [Penicillium thymicola]|uniref:Uncharacterized protein n=1 Tax=Penicillium thymicola TaxID=293382 RepID=A0AAI9XBC7_PENTH|nr:hypothetical protein VN97_g2407 [Penicillium thymicola]
MAHHRFFVLTSHIDPSPLHSNSNSIMDKPAFHCSLWFICALAKPPYITRQVLETGFSLRSFISTQDQIAPSNNNCLAVSFPEFPP